MQILAVSLIFSQPSDEVMQRATHVRDIYDQGHALLHSKSEEEAASCASMLATPMVVVTARMEMYQFLKCSKLEQREQSTSNCYGGSDGCPIMRVLQNRSPGVQHQSTLILA